MPRFVAQTLCQDGNLIASNFYIFGLIFFNQVGGQSGLEASMYSRRRSSIHMPYTAQHLTKFN